MEEKFELPRKVWMYWHQGFDQAPYVVEKCVQTWIKMNPSWEVILLDEENVTEYVDLDLPDVVLSSLSLPHLSDLIRLKLLYKYGGVWSDPTTFCNRPLNDWIEEYTFPVGFFCFSSPAEERMIANWFIAADKGSPLCLRMLVSLEKYWIENRFSSPNRLQRYALKILSPVFNKNTESTKLWFNPLVTKVLKIYPYLVFHYLFQKIILSDRCLYETWTNTKKINAKPLILNWCFGLVSVLNDDVKCYIEDPRKPVYKLTYKYDSSKYEQGTVLYYLLEERK